YQCAINTDPTNVSCSTAGAPPIVGPVDALGNPVLAGYEPAFGQSVFAVGQPTQMTVDTVGDGSYPFIESAMVTIPIWPDPYNPASATPTDKTVSALLPYLPKGSGVGFPVTIDGSRDKF